MNHRGLIASTLAALVLLIGSAGANAATLYVTEFSNGITPSGTTPAQVLPQVSQTSQTVALSGSSAASAAFGSSTHFVSLICDEGCSIQFATTGTPVATTSTTLLQQGVTYNFGVAPGWIVAAIANSAGNNGGSTGSNVTITSPVTAAGADGVSNTLTGVQTYARISCFNATTWDRCTIVPTSAAGTPASALVGVQGASGMVPVSTQTSDPCTYAQKSHKAISVTSATTTSLVAVSGSTTVYVCGFSMTIAPSATSADTAAFEYGTGAACTSPTLMTGTFGNGDLTTATGVTSVSYGGGGQTAVTSAASNGVCILTAGTTVNVQGVLTYVQQ